MKEYIERELLLIGVDGCISSLHAQAKGEPIQEAAIKLVETTRDYIASLSAADVAPVRHGRWKRHLQSDNVNPVYVCSLCKLNVSGFEKRWIKYCPNCGALMQEEDNGEK